MDNHHCLCTPLGSSKSDDVFVQLRCGDQDHQVRTGARTTTSTMMRVQVSSSWFSPSTTTPGALGSVKFDYPRVYHYRRPRRHRIRQVPCRDPEHLRTCTSTSTTVARTTTSHQTRTAS